MQVVSLPRLFPKRGGPMVAFEQLWAAWRSEYVSGIATKSPLESQGCVFCAIASSTLPMTETFTVWRGQSCFAVLNAFPYASGHLLVMPLRHVGELEKLTADEATELWQATTAAVVALKSAYGPDGVNLGANLGRAAGAGLPDHVHIHVLPRWVGDTNFMTSVAGVRVMPEALESSWKKLTDVWPLDARRVTD